MERDTNGLNQKRTRDEEDDENKESHKGKKQEIISPIEVEDDVFDFPWLKEGIVFKGDEFLEQPEDMFAPCLYLDQVQDTLLESPDQSCEQNSVVSTVDGNLEEKKFDDYGDSLWLSQVDDFEPLDCVWRCIIDQPIDNICMNKT
ncbi:hypothetical protein CDL12_14109 [Handroanthus impetiginosus]|uniref:Uncharacterized protein n=1 Tax=Handroanthus impetiginosus TaxID=429701 RepID=A0A2G9H6Y5_9LAMI|nr:hypothetical protein CDL12_14109 [Handroanthus impetiginosus]